MEFPPKSNFVPVLICEGNCCNNESISELSNKLMETSGSCGTIFTLLMANLYATNLRTVTKKKNTVRKVEVGIRRLGRAHNAYNETEIQRLLYI